MINRIDPMRARSSLATYEAIRRDLHISYSRVLEERLTETALKLLGATGTDSIEHAREFVDSLTPRKSLRRADSSNKKAHPEPVIRQSSDRAKRRAKTKSSKGKGFYRGQDYTRSTSRSSGRAMPIRITSVVSAGLPGSSRRH